MAVDQFLHGVEVIDIDTGSRVITTVRASIIGIVGTAPNADPVAFPLNTPVLIAGSRREAALLDTTGAGEGTLPSQKLGFFGSAPVVQQALGGYATDATTTLELTNKLRIALINLGLANAN